MAYFWDATKVSSRMSVINGGVRLDQSSISSAIGCGLGEPAVTSGKWYFEIVMLNMGILAACGVVNDSFTVGGYIIGQNEYSWGYRANGQKFHDNSSVSFGAGYDDGDIVGVAIDVDAGRIWFSLNGSWQGSGDPAAGSNPAFSNLSGTIFPAASLYYSSAYVDEAFNGADLTYSPPSGFLAFDDVSVGFSAVFGIDEEIGAQSMTQGISAGIGIDDEIGGEYAIRNRGVESCIGLSFVTSVSREYETGLTATVGLSVSVGASNFTRWLKENSDRAVYSYFARITGDGDSLDDFEFLGLKSFQFRMRNGTPSYLSVVLVYAAAALEAIAERQNGEIVIEMAAVVSGIEALREELIRANFHSIRTDRGGLSQSITLVGYKTRSYGNNTINLIGVMQETMLADGRMQYRCARPDFYLRPGDTAVYGPAEIVVGSISCLVSPVSQFMDVQEAAV